MFDVSFYQGKRVLLTGHTGFKGSWMSRILIRAGAALTGYSLPSPTDPSLFELADLEKGMRSTIGDIRDFETLRRTFDEAQPEIVIHMAAQPLVRDGYKDPLTTYETNVMGTVNLLECVRLTKSVRSCLNVTTDKVYENREWEWGYREIDALDGFDPYSNSKSCSELVTHSYRNSFFGDGRVALSTARAGNVIGGGDFSKDRIVPDCIKALRNGEAVVLRNPGSIRPYQHVLEPVVAYLMITAHQFEDSSLADWYNVGPDESDCVTTGKLADLVCAAWGDASRWVSRGDDGPHEADYLKLDCSKLRATFGWKPRWNIGTAVEKTVEWTRSWLTNESVARVMDRQIAEYLQGA
jgi:CDP-glucose 4,6-dehydratase